MTQVDHLGVISEQLKHWRKTRSKMGKIPDLLRQQIANLVGQYTVYQICQALHLNRRQVKDFHAEFSGAATEVASKSAFVVATTEPAALAKAPDAAAAITLELTGPTLQLRLQLACEQLLRLWPQLLRAL